MLFHSYFFVFLFLPIVLIGYALILKWFPARVGAAWLVVASLFFYSWKEPSHLLLLLCSILLNFLMGRWMSAAEGSSHRKFGLAVGVTFNLMLLAYFKYANFLVGSFSPELMQRLRLDIVLPIGISFFTFQQIAFLVDSFRNQGGCKHLIDYALFVSFFPQLIAGPIVHHHELLPQFSKKNSLAIRKRNLLIGATIFSIGLFKKTVLADQFSLFASPVFQAADAGASLTFAQCWIAAFSYTFQLYFDFSGYSDMAIGLARLFGIQLPVNFNSPYKATSIVDFWRRWHLTLSRFLKDYLYVPLGGSRKGRPRRYLNLMVTMLLGGLWHGASWTFVIWGFMHGLFLCINHAWSSLLGRVGKSAWQQSMTYRRSMTLLTFIAVVCSWLFFRAETFAGAWEMLGTMMGKHGFDFSCPEMNRRLAILWIAMGTVVVWGLPNTQQLMHRCRPALGFDAKSYRLNLSRWQSLWTWKPSFVWAIIIAVMTAIAICMIDRPSEFIYYQF